MEIILASSSPYRRALLERLQIAFTCQSPAIDEMAKPGESAIALVTRLAEEKARMIADGNPDALVIGSDQVATLGDQILTKPLTHDRAVSQLESVSGQSVTFHTGLCVINGVRGSVHCESVPFSVTFRMLQADEISRYLEKEKPYDCAGSFKSEGLGISLAEKTSGDDETALIGLPLIRLCAILRDEGVELP